MSQYNPDPATNAVDAKKLWSVASLPPSLQLSRLS